MDLSTEISNDKTVEAPYDIPPIITVLISDDRLEAFLNIDPPKNSSALSVKALMDALAKQGISENIDHDKLKELSENPVSGRNIVAARGIAPVSGIDGTVTFHIQTEEKTLKPKVNSDGTVNYRELDIVTNVSKGQVLCEITLPTEGCPGISVDGKELRQRKGRPVPNYLGRNTEYNEDGTAILSKIDGQVEFKGQKIHVDETYCITNNVDNSTGNIKAASSLVIKGMVMSGFKVEAGRNIDIGGNVENASIRSGGDIRLQSGITGSELYCSGDLQCRFIENCNIFVKGDIKAECIINSRVKCGKSVKITGRMARIIGGNCIAGQNIEANTIGSAASVETRLELGADSAVIERQQELIRQTAELKKQIENIKPLINILSQLNGSNRLTEDKKSAFEKAVYSYDTYVNLLETANKELDEIAESIKIRGFGRIVSTGTIYPGTKVLFGKTSYTVADPLKNASLYYKDGFVCIGPAF